jgi:hypothetical protein
MATRRATTAYRNHSALLVAAVCSLPAAAQPPAACQLSKIAEDYHWVTPYWGYHAPHMVYDGASYYAFGFFGKSEATTRGTIFKSDTAGTRWTRGFSWESNYQPPVILLDSRKRLIVISPQAGRPTKIFRSKARGDINRFDEISVPASIPRAGYVGAGIYKDRLVLCYNGSTAEDRVRATYDFSMAWLDLKTMKWSAPIVLAPAQRGTEPYTTWLYPVVQPDSDGIHVVVNNNPRGSVYDRAWYLDVPWNPPDGYVPKPERVSPGDTGKDFIIHMDYMVRHPDGTIYVTGRYQPSPGAPVQLVLNRRDARTHEWREIEIDHTPGTDVNFLHGAITQTPGDPNTLWVLAAYSGELRLYRSGDRGDTWHRVSLPDFGPYKFEAASYLYVIHRSSGSVPTSSICGNFQEGVTPHADYAGQYRLWFVKVDVGSPPVR